MMAEFIRPDPNATCDPRQLAAEISTAIGKIVSCDIDKERVLVYEDAIGHEAKIQEVIDAYVYDKDWDKSPAEKVAEQAKARLETLFKKGWNNLTASEKAELMQRFFEVLGGRVSR